MIARRVTRIVVLLALVGATTLRADRVDEYVAAQMKRFDVPGISFAVLKDGTIIKIGSCGLADIAHRIPAANDKVYKIGSISKQFTASGIMLLVQDGQMKLDEPVSTYLTGTPPDVDLIAVGHGVAYLYLSPAAGAAHWCGRRGSSLRKNRLLRALLNFEAALVLASPDRIFRGAGWHRRLPAPVAREFLPTPPDICCCWL